MHPVAKAQIWSDPWEGIAQLIHDQPDHPYARIGVDTIRAAMETFIGFLNTADLPYRCHAHQNAQVITPVGTLKTTYARPESMAWIDRALADRPPCLLVDFPGLKGFSAHQIKAVLHDRWPDLRTARLPFPGLTGELQTERMARRLETPAARAQLADAIRPQLGDTRGWVCRPYWALPAPNRCLPNSSRHLTFLFSKFPPCCRLSQGCGCGNVSNGNCLKWVCGPDISKKYFPHRPLPAIASF